MEIHNRVTFIAALISSFGLALVVGSRPAEAATPYLCTSAPHACEYTGPDAPVLGADVCWNGRTAKLKGAGGCPSGTWHYWVEHGTVDPITGVVQAYIALEDACEHGWCTQLTPGSQLPAENGEICCEPNESEDSGDCTLDLLTCAGEIVWCNSYESNADGTVECIETEE